MRLRVLSLAAATTGCPSRAAPDPIDTRPPTAPKSGVVDVEPAAPILEGEFVVARGGTVLYADEARTIRAMVVGDASSAGLAMKVRTASGSTLAVTPIDSGHCTGGLRFEWAALDLFVARSDLAMVLRRNTTSEFKDGTRIKLAAGTVVPDERHVRARLYSRKIVDVPVTLPASAIGPSYPQDGAFPALNALEGIAIDRIDAQLGDQHLELPNGTAVAAVVPSTGGALARITGPCTDATVRIAAREPALQRGEPDMMAEHDGADLFDRPLGTGPGGVHPRFRVAAGAAIQWPSGAGAGKVIAGVDFAVEPEVLGGWHCFPTLHRWWIESEQRLCFAAATVERRDPPRDDAPAGSGYLSGPGFGGRGKAVPRVRQGKHTVKGPLDGDIIRRIVRAHINEIRYCYNQGLNRNPKLQGGVTIAFEINPAGKVPVAKVTKRKLKDKNVADCMAKAVRRWKFPRPQGGKKVDVTYPFELSPGRSTTR